MNPLLDTSLRDQPSTALPAPLRDCQRDIAALCRVGREFHARGWSLGTSSNYSVVQSRDPLKLLITASGKDKGDLQRHDFVLVDQHGQSVADGQPKSSAETLLHCLLVNDPQVGAVLHTHSVWGTVLSELYAEQGGLVIEDYEMLKGLEGIATHRQCEWVHIFDNSQDIPSLADVVGQRLAQPAPGQVHGFLLRQHGLYTWGRDLFAARRHVEIFEFLFECVARKMMLQGRLSATDV